uniref:ECA polymerase n=1 Tax=Elaeophora elaphi TaxID=1147741 RepID=A0A0R3RSN2_9BILA
MLISSVDYTAYLFYFHLALLIFKSDDEGLLVKVPLHLLDQTEIRLDFMVSSSLPTYGAFGAGAVLALIYMTNWETVGRRIPIWKYHFESIENSSSANASS